MCTHWHGLGKLQMHTDHTLKIFDQVTVSLGEHFRAFAHKICPAFDTYELLRETKARECGKLTKSDAASAKTKPSTTARQQKAFNLSTYKYHSLGDYAATIRRVGTCDSYSTELVSGHAYVNYEAGLTQGRRLGRASPPDAKGLVFSNRL